MRTLLLELRSRLDDLTDGLPRVTVRRMFGCDAFLAGGAIFAMVWRVGRIGLRLPDALLPELRALPGADPWRHRDMVVRQWVLVPESFHDDAEALAPWVRKAHAAALERGPTQKRSSRPPPVRRRRKASTPRPPRRRGRQSSKKV
ncbi:MAG TPA: TfoX/Sxy family protein [Myxococcaceae bacterium]|jgi:TfoX/Sxy family transcriptional regulator of competence genes